MTKSKATRVYGNIFHKHKYLIIPGVTTEKLVIAEKGKLSQDLGGNKTNHLSETTLDQFTSLGNIIKKRIEDKEEQDRSAQQNKNQTIIQ